MVDDEPRFAKGDLNAVMNAHPHVAEWIRDFESSHGSRPIYYGELDRGAKKERPYNLIYITQGTNFCSYLRTSCRRGRRWTNSLVWSRASTFRRRGKHTAWSNRNSTPRGPNSSIVYHGR